MTAIHSFPNEVLDEILGHLVTSLPPSSKQDTSKKSPALQALATVSLVSRQWRAVALRRLVSKLVVRTGSRARAITKGLTIGSLGSLVKELTIDGQGGSSKGVPMASELAKKDWVTPEDVVALLSQTPRINVLQLHYVPFVRFRQRDIATISALPFLTTVKTLSIRSAVFDTNGELVATLIPLFSTLRSLDIVCYSKTPRLPRIPTPQPELEALGIVGITPTTLLSLISIPAPRKLKALRFRHYSLDQLDHLEDLMTTALEELDLPRYNTNGIPAALFQWCPGLVKLGVGGIFGLNEALHLLRDIPATVTTLRLNYGSEYLLEALETTPKPLGLVTLECRPPYGKTLLEDVPKFLAFGIQAILLNKLRGTSSTKERKERPFLHLKFGDGKPPEFGHHHRFAHQLSLIPPHDLVLPEGLSTDVQREGIGRYLTNNFKEGSPVHEVVHERGKDESTFILVTQNWHRSSGDQKLHLSLYVYQEDRHCATWHAFTDRTISLHGPARSKSASATPYTTPSDLQSAHPPPAPRPSRANEEVLRARLDRPSAAPPKLDDADSTASTTRTRNSRFQEHESDSSEEVEEPKRPARVAKPAARDDSDDEELGDSSIPAPNSRSPLPPRSNPNPHSRAPTPSAVASAPPAASHSARSGKDDPPPSRADDWDAPPPEEDVPTSPDSWIQPPADEPNEGFEELFGRHKSSKRTTRKPRPPSSSPPPETTSKLLPKKSQHQRDKSPSPERPRPSRAPRREQSDVDDVEPTPRGRSDDPPARSSRRAPSKARSLVDEGVEAIKRKEKELEERERRLKEMELEERERKLKEREAEILAKEKASFKAKERDLDRDEEQAFVRERRKERRERSRSRSPGGSPTSPPPPRSARRKSFSDSSRPLSPPTAASDDERPAEPARKRSESRVRDVHDSKAADLTYTSRRNPRPQPSAPPAEDEGFEVSSLKPTRSRIEDEPAPLGAVAALGGWVRGVTARLKGQTLPVEEDPAVEDDEELEEERRRRRAARKERRKRRETELAEAEDAVASAADAERRSKAKKPIEGTHGDLDEVDSEDRRPRSTRNTRSDSPADVETDAEERRSRRSHPTRPKPIVEESSGVEKPLRDSRPIKPAEVEPESGRSTRRTRPPKPTSDSDEEPPKSASTQRDHSSNPPTRQRAMSLSASVDAGLRGLRESVAKAVENIARPKEEAEVGGVNHRSSRTPRRNDPREEARNQDDDSDAGDRRPVRKSRGLEADGHETDVSSRSSRRVKPGTTELHKLEEKAPPSRSRSSRKPKSVATDGEESDALPSTRKSRSEPRTDQLLSESDAPSTSSRKDPSSRKKPRETSEEELEETEMDKIAKANTNVNSSTITPDEILAAKVRFTSGQRAILIRRVISILLDLLLQLNFTT